MRRRRVPSRKAGFGRDPQSLDGGLRTSCLNTRYRGSHSSFTLKCGNDTILNAMVDRQKFGGRTIFHHEVQELLLIRAFYGHRRRPAHSRRDGRGQNMPVRVAEENLAVGLHQHFRGMRTQGCLLYTSDAADE